MREQVKSALALAPARGPALGATVLIYHRVGGGTTDELDLPTDAFLRQLDVLAQHEVLALDAALDRLNRGDSRPSVVITFDDGYDDVFTHAWPYLRDRRLPFVIYLATAYVGSAMRWPGSTSKGRPGTGLSWSQLDEMAASGLLTIANHTHSHVRPEEITVEELDRCNDEVERHLGVRPAHFTYPWGRSLPSVEPLLATRFRSASSGELGRNLPASHPMRLRRVPVRRTDPDRFFRAKLGGRLGPERAYARVVEMAKRVGVRA
jgi:peptidoglycan/xylan/chitin deacetylase (PgdA/CDA1 family)